MLLSQQRALVNSSLPKKMSGRAKRKLASMPENQPLRQPADDTKEGIRVFQS